MSDSWAKIISDIKQDVGRVANRIARGTAMVALEDLREAHSAIMDDFYDGYTPVESYTYYNYVWGRLYIGRASGYKRTGNLRNNSFTSLGVKQVGSNGFKASVYVGPQNMDGYINSTGKIFPPEKVFDLMWNKSIRGLPPGYKGHIAEFSISANPVGVPITGSPDEAMRDFVDSWGSIRGAQVADIFAYD